MGDGTEYDTTIQLDKALAKWLHNALARSMYSAGMSSDATEYREMWKLRSFLGMAANLNSDETVEFTVEVKSWGA